MNLFGAQMGAIGQVTFLQDTRNSSQFLWERGGKDPFWRQEGGVSRRLRTKLTQMWVEVVWGEGVTCQMLHLTGQNTTEGQV